MMMMVIMARYSFVEIAIERDPIPTRGNPGAINGGFSGAFLWKSASSSSTLEFNWDRGKQNDY